MKEKPGKFLNGVYGAENAKPKQNEKVNYAERDISVKTNTGLNTPQMQILKY